MVVCSYHTVSILTGSIKLDFHSYVCSSKISYQHQTKFAAEMPAMHIPNFKANCASQFHDMSEQNFIALISSLFSYFFAHFEFSAIKCKQLN